MKEKEFSFAIIPDIELGRPHFDLCDARIWNPTKRKERVVAKGIEERLAKAVGFVNSLQEVEFVVTVGDLTDSASPGQFWRAKEILDKLNVPWIPVIGNHDAAPRPYLKKWDPILSLRHSWGPEGPAGLEYFESIFKDNFQKLLGFFQNFEKQERSEMLLENFAFTFKSIRFIVVDNVNRLHALFGPGVVPWSRLYPKSREWLREQLSKGEEIKIVISHVPLNRKLLKSFSGNQKIVNIAGHVHKERELRKSNLVTFVTGALYLKPVIYVAKVLADDVEIHSVRIP